MIHFPKSWNFRSLIQITFKTPKFLYINIQFLIPFSETKILSEEYDTCLLPEFDTNSDKTRIVHAISTSSKERCNTEEALFFYDPETGFLMHKLSGKPVCTLDGSRNEGTPIVIDSACPKQNFQPSFCKSDKLFPILRWSPLARAAIAPFGFNPFCLEKRLRRKSDRYVRSRQWNRSIFLLTNSVEVCAIAVPASGDRPLLFCIHFILRFDVFTQRSTLIWLDRTQLRHNVVSTSILRHMDVKWTLKQRCVPGGKYMTSFSMIKRGLKLQKYFIVKVGDKLNQGKY